MVWGGFVNEVDCHWCFKFICTWYIYFGLYLVHLLWIVPGTMTNKCTSYKMK